MIVNNMKKNNKKLKCTKNKHIWKNDKIKLNEYCICGKIKWSDLFPWLKENKKEK